jgi:hypothetical protein
MTTIAEAKTDNPPIMNRRGIDERLNVLNGVTSLLATPAAPAIT